MKITKREKPAGLSSPVVGRVWREETSRLQNKKKEKKQAWEGSIFASRLRYINGDL